ncbi:beta-galactosidase trimerization domain-containing protein [bacterium]|nr:beta-galactosidase trimerization domain-containing protein [bacterium]
MELRFRQIHLDFHTSEDIPDIGAKFDAEEYASTLDKARVNSISTFARCHHGWLYYDSKAFPERVHPQLANKNLLNEQIEACHKRGIRVPIYITVQWDHYSSQRHPEWCVVNPEGKLAGTPPYEAGFYRALCVNTPFRDFLKEQTREVLETLPTDGIFYDIVMTQDCSCWHCKQDMLAQGYDPYRKEDRIRFAKEMLDGFKKDMTEFVRGCGSDCAIFYNAGHIGPGSRESLDAYTHLELESLPSGHWGYIHFPLSVRFARNLGLDFMGMTGKFHTSWADFHSYKNQPALEYECFNMLACNAKCGIGDQLPPDGKIDQATYDLIGSVYRQVEEKEPWCRGAKAVTDIAVLTTEEWMGERMPPATAGAVLMLLEGGHQFEIVDSRSDFSPYKVLVLPDRVPVNDALRAKIEKFLSGGGKLLVTGESGLNPEQTAFNLDLGVTLHPNPTRDLDGNLVRGKVMPRGEYTDFVLPRGDLAKGLPEVEHVMYAKGVEVSLAGGEVLANAISSYFNRDWRHFCSHQHTPSSGEVAHPAIVRKGNAIYFSHPVFSLYRSLTPLWAKRLVLNALDLLLPEPLLRHDGPSTLQTTVNEQKGESRWVVHLLHYIPQRRGEAIDVIEDVIPLFDTALSLKTPKKPKSIRLVPQNREIPFEEKDGRILFTVPKIEGHAMVEVTY